MLILYSIFCHLGYCSPDLYMIHYIPFAVYLSCSCDCDLDSSVNEESGTKYFVAFLPVVFCHASVSLCS